MANTYTQLYIQLVFAIKHRRAFIQEHFREDLQKYITGIVQKNGHKMLAIYCMPDHTHILIGLHPKQSISDLMRDIKASSSKWLNEQGFIEGRFEWQTGYAAFSYSRSLLDTVVKYIQNQKVHHQKYSFQDEYIKFLKKFEIDYKPEYLFDNED